MARVAQALQKGSTVRCSRYGAPGGVYMAILAPKHSTTKVRKRGKNAAPFRRKPLADAGKVRRVDRDDAINVIRRQPGEPGDDRITELFWVPPELVIVLTRDEVKRLVERRKLLPVWDNRRGRRLDRGAAVVRG